jgi:ADP-ribose pyrophosphatase
MDRSWQVISSTPRFEGRVFRVRTDEVRLDDGTHARLDVIEHPGSYGIIALPAPGQIVLVRQYRHAVGRELWEIPAGTAEPGESVLDGAARELAEETGFRAGRLRSLGALYVTPGFCNESMHFVEASDLQPGERDLDEDERIDVGVYAIDEAEGMLLRGEIADAKTAVALLWMRGKRGELVSGRADNSSTGLTDAMLD